MSQEKPNIGIAPNGVRFDDWRRQSPDRWRGQILNHTRNYAIFWVEVDSRGTILAHSRYTSAYNEIAIRAAVKWAFTDKNSTFSSTHQHASPHTAALGSICPTCNAEVKERPSLTETFVGCMC